MTGESLPLCAILFRGATAGDGFFQHHSRSWFGTGIDKYTLGFFLVSIVVPTHMIFFTTVVVPLLLWQVHCVLDIVHAPAFREASSGLRGLVLWLTLYCVSAMVVTFSAHPV